MVTKLEVVYYAKCHDTGEIWECDNLKSLVHCVTFSFKMDMHSAVYYDSRFAVLCYGVVIHFDDGHCEYHCYRQVCNIFVSGCSGNVHSYIDRA